MAQLMMMIMGQTPQAGGDSAFLESPSFSQGGGAFGGATGLWFDGAEYQTTDRDSALQDPFTWYTGTGSQSDYEAQYIQTSLEGLGYWEVLNGAETNTWYVLGGTNPTKATLKNPPYWLFTSDSTTSSSSGYLVIRNKNTQVELANVVCTFSIGDAV